MKKPYNKPTVEITTVAFESEFMTGSIKGSPSTGIGWGGKEDGNVTADSKSNDGWKIW